MCLLARPSLVRELQDSWQPGSCIVKGIPSGYGVHLSEDVLCLASRRARDVMSPICMVQVYENSPSLGGIWNYQEEVQHCLSLRSVCCLHFQRTTWPSTYLLALHAQIEDDLLGRDPHRHIVHSSL